MPALGIPGAALPATPAVHSLGLTGFWNNIQVPAAYYNGKTYVAYIDSSRKVYAASYDHGSGTVSTPHLFGTATVSPDGTVHNAPSILVRASDHRLIVAQSSDAASEYPVIWISTNPEDATAWPVSGTTIGSTLSGPTYSVLVQAAAVSGQPIYYFLRKYDSPTFHYGYFKSTDGGSSWSAFQSLLTSGTGSGAVYLRAFSNGSRVDIFTTDTDRYATPSQLRHMYLDSSDNLRTSDGTLIGAASGGPYLASTGTVVQDASLGAAECAGYAYDSLGRPACAIHVNDADASTNSLIRVGRWNGSSWSTHAVASAGGVVGSNDEQTWAAMANGDPNTIYVPVKVSTKFELKAYTSADDGATWSATSLTTGSSNDNIAVQVPTNAAPGARVVWGLGSFTDASTFTFTIQTYG